MKSNLHQSALWSGGLAAVSIAMLQGLLSLSTLNVVAFISVISFALAIPILTCNTLVKLTKAERRGNVYDTKAEIFFYLLGMISGFVGVVAVFWRISSIAGFIFLISTFIALVVYFRSIPRTHNE